MPSAIIKVGWFRDGVRFRDVPLQSVCINHAGWCFNTLTANDRDLRHILYSTCVIVPKRLRNITKCVPYAPQKSNTSPSWTVSTLNVPSVIIALTRNSSLSSMRANTPRRGATARTTRTPRNRTNVRSVGRRLRSRSDCNVTCCATATRRRNRSSARSVIMKLYISNFSFFVYIFDCIIIIIILGFKFTYWHKF